MFQCFNNESNLRVVLLLCLPQWRPSLNRTRDFFICLVRPCDPTANMASNVPNPDPDPNPNPSMFIALRRAWP